ncbi:oxidoreductase [Paraburkholderia sp. LEh10]|uniref:PDR/VanB family oxidoreductase n=1 Tax=Paraburkholderia sp. LEh10 TaxID=2821353 RepID=UPI001AEAA390|nr:PDR/VanB family oxidoreductase [Paraburkholderia sp. LEh10]MBP0592163.1 oxidoreductase [Paraburkholderia sp. LEh10]
MTATLTQTAFAGEEDTDDVATLDDQRARADAAGFLSLEVTARSEIAEDIHLFELRASDGAPLPPFSAGAHVLVRTPAGIERRYSLCSSPVERDRYLIAVKFDADGRGGSASMTRDVRVGTRLKVAPPENYFALTGDAARYLLIAGGIGITPLRAMIAELDARNADYRVLYCTRTPESTAFLDELRASDRVVVHHDFGERDRSFALAPYLAARDGNTHLYCCGPRPLMQAVREAASHWPSSAVHFEDFGTSAHACSGESGGDKPFVVRLARSGQCVNVQAGESILDALRAHGVETPSSCEAGTCGSCRTRLVAGEADHRDFVLDEDEYDSAIMICVSRAKSDELVLDL